MDEAGSALGLARAAAGADDELGADLLRLQTELYVLGAELATAPEAADRLEAGVSKVTSSMTELAEADIDVLVDQHPLRDEFVLSGESLGAASLDLARAIVRRAERQAVALERSGGLPDAEILRYLNRVSDLLFALARFEEAERGLSPKPSRARGGTGVEA